MESRLIFLHLLNPKHQGHRLESYQVIEFRDAATANSYSWKDCQEKLVCRAKGARTVNRHRWVGRIYQGERVKPG